jgi:hypothetical protein
LEIRELGASTELKDFLGKEWVGVAQVFQLTRTVHEISNIPKQMRLFLYTAVTDSPGSVYLLRSFSLEEGNLICVLYSLAIGKTV